MRIKKGREINGKKQPRRYGFQIAPIDKPAAPIRLARTSADYRQIGCFEPSRQPPMVHW
jgi:hypothetical protein